MADRLRRPLLYVPLVLLVLSSCYYVFYYYPSYGSPFQSFSDTNVTRNTTLRPRIHFTPDRHWMNDPNGLFVDANKLWHLYYQYCPVGVSPGPVSWGHATSTDLFHWDIQPLALQSSARTGSMYTGSIVLDSNNTSSLFPTNNASHPGIVAVYTQHFDSKEVQAIATSNNGGFTFEQDLPQNPVIDLQTRDFRDPKVFWHSPTSRWIMVVANAGQGFIYVYSSENLISWREESQFHPDVHDTSYECPNLVPIPIVPDTEKVDDAWILLVSSGGDSPLNGGSVTRYYPGSFNGTHFTAFDDRTDRFVDFGPDIYAAQFFTDGRKGDDRSSWDINGSPTVQKLDAPIFMAWASNLRYAANVPTGWREGWRGVQTLPRAVTLTPEWDLVSSPVGLSSLAHVPLGVWEGRGDGRARIDIKKSQGAILVEGNITFVASESSWLEDDQDDDESGSPEVRIEISNNKGEKLVFGWILSTQRWRPAHFTTDRTDATGKWNPPREYRDGRKLQTIGDVMSTKLRAIDVGGSKGWKFFIILDRSIAEVFLNDGIQVGTMGYWPHEELDGANIVLLRTHGNIRVEIAVSGLD